MTTEAQIQADVDALRAEIADTQALYREVCTVLFFRYGITPTANRLYQYVRKGSMSAPATALAKFWEDLRDKSRVRIEHPDLPDGVKSAAGDLVASLWTQAQAAAQDGLSVFRAEAQAEVLDAKTGQATAEQQLTEARMALDAIRQTAQAAMERALHAERQVVEERASKTALTQRLEAAGHQQVALETALVDARRDFAAELGKLRQSLERSEERAEASEKRALLEIDRERTTAAKLQKEVVDLHKEQARFQNEAAETRQKLGVTEGALQEMRVANQRQEGQVIQLQQELTASQGRTSTLTQEVQRLRAVRPLAKDEISIRRRPRTTLR
jgi:predicted  nucleic acid-binding Zn-ribbon protein